MAPENHEHTKTSTKKAQTTVFRCLGYKYFFLSFFHVLCILTKYFYVYLGTINALKAREGLGWVTTTKAGPNDASGVVWAISTCFFKNILCSNYVYLGTIYVLKVREGLWWAATTETGPNDASGV